MAWFTKLVKPWEKPRGGEGATWNSSLFRWNDPIAAWDDISPPGPWYTKNA